MMRWWAQLICAASVGCFACHHVARAQESPSSGSPPIETSCRSVESDVERLKCYDAVVAQQGGDERESVPISQATKPQPSLMGTRWELDAGTQQGLFSVRPHKQSYLLPARYTTDVNNQPSSPTQGTLPQSLGYSNTEVKFQFSFKVKALEIKNRLDLWIAYTQLSFFQMYSKSISAPFRETNYEPELMSVIHADYTLFGLRADSSIWDWFISPTAELTRCREVGTGCMPNSVLSETDLDFW